MQTASQAAILNQARPLNAEVDDDFSSAILWYVRASDAGGSLLDDISIEGGKPTFRWMDRGLAGFHNGEIYVNRNLRASQLCAAVGHELTHLYRQVTGTTTSMAEAEDEDDYITDCLGEEATAHGRAYIMHWQFEEKSRRANFDHSGYLPPALYAEFRRWVSTREYSDWDGAESLAIEFAGTAIERGYLAAARSGQSYSDTYRAAYRQWAYPQAAQHSSTGAMSAASEGQPT